MSPEERCLFDTGNKNKVYANILSGPDLVSLNRGVPKEDFHCISMLKHLHLLSGQILEKPDLFNCSDFEPTNRVVSGTDALFSVINAKHTTLHP